MTNFTQLETLALDIPPALAKFIATRDRRIEKVSGWNDSAISNSFRHLLQFGEVIVGGRASCGGRPDPTWVQLCAWNEVIRKARAMGFDIKEESIKQGNAWATKAGGFWSESRYTIPSAQEAA
jgi:hypothetical protein